MDFKVCESRKVLLKIFMIATLLVCGLFMTHKDVYADLPTGAMLHVDDGSSVSGVYGRSYATMFVNVDNPTDTTITLPYYAAFIHPDGSAFTATDLTGNMHVKFTESLSSTANVGGIITTGNETSGDLTITLPKAYVSTLNTNNITTLYQRFCDSSDNPVWNIQWNIVPISNVTTNFILGIPNVYDNVDPDKDLMYFETYLGSDQCNTAVKNYFTDASTQNEWVISESQYNFGYDISEIGPNEDTMVVPKAWDSDSRYATFTISMKATGAHYQMCTFRCDYGCVIGDNTCTFDAEEYENAYPALFDTSTGISLINAHTQDAVLPDTMLNYMTFKDDEHLLTTPVKVTDITGIDFQNTIKNGWNVTDVADIIASDHIATGINLSAVNYLARGVSDTLVYKYTTTTFANMFTNIEINSLVPTVIYPTVNFNTGVSKDVYPDANCQIPFSDMADLFDVVLTDINDLLLYDDNGLMSVSMTNPIMTWNDSDDAFDVTGVGFTDITFTFTNPVTSTVTYSGTISVNVIPTVTIDPTKVPSFGIVSYADTPDGIYDMNLADFVTIVPATTDFGNHTHLEVTDSNIADFEYDRNGNALPYGKFCVKNSGIATFTITSDYDVTQNASFTITIVPDIAVSGSYCTTDHEYNSGSAVINVTTGRITDSSFVATSTTPNIGDYDIDDLIEFDFGAGSNLGLQDNSTSGTQFINKTFKFLNVNSYGTNRVKIFSKNPFTGVRSAKLAEFNIVYKPSSMFDVIPDVDDFQHEAFMLADYTILPVGATWADVIGDITVSGYDTNIVDVDMTNNGKIILKAIGDTDMTVTTSRPDVNLGGADTRTFHINVKQIPVISVKDVPDATIYYNGSYKVANPFTSDIPGYEGWTSSVTNPIVKVTEGVDHKCKVVPTGVGSTYVVLTNVFDKTKQTSFKVTVKPVITFHTDIPTMTVAVNSTNVLPLVADIEPVTADLYNYIRWEPKNKLMLDINSDNVHFTTKDSDLSTTITAYDATYPEAEQNDHKVTFTVDITQTATLSDLTDMELYKGDIITYPECSSDMSKVRWAVEGDDCVQLTNKHIVALTSGVAKLTASMVYDPNIKKSCLIKVYAPVESITFAESGQVYDVNDHIEVQEPIIAPADARIKKVLWTSSDPEVLTIDSDTGEITPIREGTTVISATATDGSGVEGTYGITITDAVFHEVVAIKVSYGGKVINSVDVAKDETAKLSYSVAPYNATNRDVKVEVINKDHPESADDEKYVGDVALEKSTLHYGETINITGKTEGICKLKLTALDGSDVDAYVTVNVTGEIVDEISFAQSHVTLYTNDPEVPYFKNTVYGKPSTGVIPKLEYTSSDPEIASVDGSGKVTAKNAGTVKITAKYHGTKKDLEADYVVDVVKSILVESLKFEKETVTISSDKTDYSNKLIINPSNATNPRIKYFTSDATIASVNASTGVVKPVKAGEVTITAAANDGSAKVAFYKLTIKPVYVTSISFEKSSIDISDLDPATHTNKVTVSPANATNKTLRYSSSDTSVATVNASTGAVSSVHAGTCMITAVAQDGSGVSGAYTVNVTEGTAHAVKNIRWDNELQGITWDSLEDKFAIGYLVKFDRKSTKKNDDDDDSSDYIELDSPVLPVEQFGFTPTAGTSYGFKVYALYRHGYASKATRGSITLYRITFYPGVAETTVTKGTGTDAKSEKKQVTPSGSMSQLWGGKDTDYTLPECGFYAKGFDFDGWMVNNGSPQPAGAVIRITGQTNIEATWKENEEAQKTSASGTGNGKTSELTSLDALHAYSKIGAFNNDFTTYTPLNYTELKDVPFRERANHGMLANYCTSVLNNYFESKFTAACVDMAVVSPGPNIECPEVWKNGRRNIFWASPLAYASDTIFAIWYCDETKQLVYLPCEMLAEGEVTFRVPRVGWSSVISLWKLEDEETVKYFGADTHGIKGIALNIASKGLAYREDSEMSGISYDVNQGILPLWNKNGSLGVASGLYGTTDTPVSDNPTVTDPLLVDPDNPSGPAERVTMPNVVGYKAEEAVNILREAGITNVTEIKINTSDPSMDGLVKISQPSYGGVINSTDTVKLLVGSYQPSGGGGGYTPKNNQSTDTSSDSGSTEKKTE